MGSNAPSSNRPGFVPKLPWFSTRGQAVDLAIKIALAVLAGINAWHEMKNNEFLSIGALLFYGLVVIVLISLGVVLKAIRKTRYSPDYAPASGPLHILSAHWGIGGDASKDVTEIVRRHAKPDSINIPASVGLFGDPYSGSGKYLNVVYSFARRREITVPELVHLVLPEKEGEEQSKKALEARHAQLDALRRPDDCLVAKISQTEWNLYTAMEKDFVALPWCQKLALRRIHILVNDSIEQFKIALTNDGFVDSAQIVDQLMCKGFLEQRNGILRIAASTAKFIDVILEKHPTSW